MNNGLKTYFLSLLIGTPIIVGTMLLRPFWHSEWGPSTFVLICWMALSLYLGWGGKGKPYSLRFGLIAGSAITLYAVMTFLITKYTGINMYIGMIPFFLLVYVSTKSKIVKDRIREVNPDEGD
ncbi:hypothetical protein [Rhizobium sp. TH2]|uniref:hypothetical protein n=1 Tax=Rhizobium sp. TH2 TaxID=2775403 RepID=UPI0021570D33|nr:hypothetical protein [Rhizobium sp. TH2]